MTECEIPELYVASEQRANKEYVCCECGAAILAGETYLKATGKWDGKFNVYRQHLLCARACEYVRDKYWTDDCLGFGGLLEWIDTDAYGLTAFSRERPEQREFRQMIVKIKWRARKQKGGRL